MNAFKVCDYCNAQSDLIELHESESESRFICLKHLKGLMQKDEDNESESEGLFNHLSDEQLKDDLKRIEDEHKNGNFQSDEIERLNAEIERRGL